MKTEKNNRGMANKLGKRYSYVYDIMIIFVIFITSIFIRYQNLEGNLSRRQELNTAMIMIALENLEKQGAINHGFLCLQSYPLNNDKYICNWGRTMDDQGNWYYTSFPPFSIICPYIVFKIAAIDVSLKNIQVFNMITHFIGAIFLYLTVAKILPEKNKINMPAILASLFYIYMPSNIWTFTNVYCWNVFCNPLWIICIYVITALIENIEKNVWNQKLLCALGIINFLMVYTEYLGHVTAFTLIAFAFLKRRESRQYVWIIRIVLTTAIIAIVLPFIQITFVGGLSSLINLYLAKAIEMSAFSKEPFLLLRIAYYYKISFLPGLIWNCVLIVIAIIIYKTKIVTLINKKEAYVLMFTFLPIILHHFILLRWTSVHHFSVLHSSVFIAILASIVLKKIYIYIEPKRKKLLSIALGLTMVFIGKISMDLYYNEFATRGHKRHFEAGQYIKENAKEDETVFLNKFPHPQTVYFAKRNIQPVRNVEEAKEWLRKKERKKGVIFFEKGEGAVKYTPRAVSEIVRVERFNTE